MDLPITPPEPWRRGWGFHFAHPGAARNAGPIVTTSKMIRAPRTTASA
jgi:hypothetical protein